MLIKTNAILFINDSTTFNKQLQQHIQKNTEARSKITCAPGLKATLL